jgi:hypothetical protein
MIRDEHFPTPNPALGPACPVCGSDLEPGPAHPLLHHEAGFVANQRCPRRCDVVHGPQYGLDMEQLSLEQRLAWSLKLRKN